MSITAIEIKKSGYLHLADIDFSGVLSEELEGLDSGFERIRIPSAGSTVFEFPGDDPSEPDAVKEFSAVVLYQHPLHAYYHEKYTGGNNPPDCGSFDGKVGRGIPGGDCRACPLNRFGSGENGSKACKNRRRIYVLPEGEIFPILLSLPTGSLKEFSRYIKRLLSKGKRPNQVVTKFSLKKATNSNGLQYSQAVFTVERLLAPEECELISLMSEEVKARSKNVGFENESAVICEEYNPFTDGDER